MLLLQTDDIVKWVNDGVAMFNLQTGLIHVETDPELNATMELVGDGWYRCSIQMVGAAAATITSQNIQLSDGTGTNYQGSNANYAQIWGAQFEESPVATSFIYTLESADTRGADDCRLDIVGNVPDDLEEFTIIMDISMNIINQNAVQRAWYSDVTRAISPSFDSSLFGNLVIANGSLNVNTGTLLEVNKVYRIALAATLTNDYVYVDGVEVFNAPGSQNLTRDGKDVSLGSFEGTSQFLEGHIRNLKVFDRLLTPLQIKAA